MNDFDRYKDNLAARFLIDIGRLTGRFNDKEGVIVEGRLCADCARRYYSFPYECNDGWAFSAPEGMTTAEWLKKAERCQNYKEIEGGE